MEETNNYFRSFKLFKILSNPKEYQTLEELNKELRINKEAVLLEDREIGTYLHQLTQNACNNDE